MVTSIFEQKPARCSSIELSSTSNTMWCRPRSSGSPMYMPGRLRTASSPSNLSICAAPYFCVKSMLVVRSAATDFMGKSSSVLGIEDGRATTEINVGGNRPCHNKYLAYFRSNLRNRLQFEATPPQHIVHINRRAE